VISSSADGHLFGASYGSWNLAFAAIASVTVLVGGIIGVAQLASVARSNRLNGLIVFQEAVRGNEARTWTILNEFPVRACGADFSDVDATLLGEASLLVNSVNDVGQLVEAGLVDPRLYFQLYYTQLLRIVFVLRPYTEWRELQLGGMYGRRLRRLEYSARHWHELGEQRADLEILLSRPEGQYVVLARRRRPGIADRVSHALCLRSQWWARRALRLGDIRRESTPSPGTFRPAAP